VAINGRWYADAALKKTLHASVLLDLGLKGYEHSHPGTKVFEPDQRDPTLFLANTFGYRQRQVLAEHACQRMRADLRSRRPELAATLARHGLALHAAVLDDPVHTAAWRPTTNRQAPGPRAAPAGRGAGRGVGRADAQLGCCLTRARAKRRKGERANRPSSRPGDGRYR
jgi:hypothetical protein